MSAAVGSPCNTAAPPSYPRVTDDAWQRVAVISDFFTRNPGYMPTGRAGDVVRAAAAHIPGMKTLSGWTKPTPLGQGEPIAAHMQWQTQSGRQPDNTWWVDANRIVIETPLIAEAYVRSNRESEVKDPAVKAWMNYIHASDKIAEDLHANLDANRAVITAANQAVPAAISDAWKGAGLHERAKVYLWDVPNARKALWKAHAATVEKVEIELHDELIGSGVTAPDEAAFATGWMSMITGIGQLIPVPSHGKEFLHLERVFLPEKYPATPSKISPIEKTFTWALDVLDRKWENDIDPAIRRASQARS